MSLGLFVSLVLVACHPGKASVLRPSLEEPADAQSPPIIRTNRCLGDPLQSIRKTILDSLNLQTEPHVSVPGLAQIREQWRNVFRGTSNSSPTEQHAGDNTQSSSSSAAASSSLSSSSRSGNSTHLQCCRFASQVFMTDLGWDKWIIYPESFTFVQCSMCDRQQNQQQMFYCGGDDPTALDPPSQNLCCEATSLVTVPFLYIDETSTLVISSVPQTRECGCSHGDDTQTLQP